MIVKKGQLVELKISDIAFGGKGVARINGLAIFVDQAVPLDLIIARIIKKKKNHAEARVVEMVEPSPFRSKPLCIYSGFCGGCKWQFLEYDRQLIYKCQHVINSIEHIGLITGISVHSTLPSEQIFGYRNKMEFSCSDQRWLLPDELKKEGVSRDFALGLHPSGSFHKIIDTKACHLQPKLGNQILETVRTYMKDSGAPPYGVRSHVGFWRFLMLRHSKAFDQWMVNIITAKEDLTKTKPLADLLIKTYPSIISVINNITSRKAGVAIGEYEILLAGASTIKDKIGLFEFEISSNSFFQTNSLGAERLFETVKDYAELTGTETVLDLYSGTGAIAIFLADTAKEVIGIEISEGAVTDAKKNCHINRISNCRFIHGDMMNALSDAAITPDVMIIDPPRAGVHKKVIKQIIEIAPRRIVYVSCNPATLARDLCMIKEQYRILDVQPVDMFPHTYHVEAVVKLERKSQSLNLRHGQI